MHPNLFSVVLVLVALRASESTCFEFSEELPLYLSDDILITKRSATKNFETQATVDEQSKYESDVKSQHAATITEGYDRLNKKDESEKKEESGLVFLPSFGRRTRREVKHGDTGELLGLRESNIVFLPSFRRNDLRRSRRDTVNYEKYEMKRSVENQIHDENVRRYNFLDKNGNNYAHTDSDLDNSENGLVFLPSFGRRTKRYVLVDSDIASDDNQSRTGRAIETTERNEELTDAESENQQNSEQFQNESEDEQESGLVFIPSFGRRTRSLITKREVPSSDNENEQNGDTTTEKSSKKSIQDESEIEEESGLVFIPSFGRRTRRHTVERDVSSSEIETKKNNGSIQKNGSEESEKEQESGLVFIPSFGRRTRRDTAPSDISSHPNNDIDRNLAATSTKKNEKESEIEQESGLVFLPSFGRRSRRDISSNKDEEKTKTSSESLEKPFPQTKKNESEDEEESGLVFQPSFGRRTRRELLPKEKLLVISKREADEPKNILLNQDSKKIENKQIEDNDMDESENGMVFLASFGKRH